MSELRIKDGTGAGNTAKVGEDNRLQTRSVSLSAAAQRSFEGAGYNFNTGVIQLTTGNESAVFYMKYTGSAQFHVTRIVAAFGPLSGAVSGSIEMFVVKNPTAGTIVSDTIAVDMNDNRDFSSANTLSVDVYKGSEGKTLTDGTNILLFFASDNSRSITPVDLIMSGGNSLGINMTLNAADGGDIYIAVVGYETESR